MATLTPFRPRPTSARFHPDPARSTGPRQLLRLSTLGMLAALVLAGVGAQAAEVAASAGTSHGALPALDLSGAIEGRWMRDELGLTILVRHPGAAFPDGALSRTGLTKEVRRRTRVKGRWVRRNQTIQLAPAEAFQDDRVLVFLPKDLELDKPVQLLVFFHGWRSRVTGASSTAEALHLRESVACAGRNTVLVMPQGPVGVATSRFGRLEKLSGLTALVGGLAPLLPPLPGEEEGVASWLEQVDRVALAGHSGGGSPITKILEDGVDRGLDGEGEASIEERTVWNRLKTVILLDATYSGQKALEAWWTARPGRVLRSYYLPGSPTAAVSQGLAALAGRWPERRAELDIEAIAPSSMPEPVKSEPHFAMPWYRLWRGLGAKDGACRWAQPVGLEPVGTVESTGG